MKNQMVSKTLALLLFGFASVAWSTEAPLQFSSEGVNWLKNKPRGVERPCRELLVEATSAIEALSQNYWPMGAEHLTVGEEVEGYVPKSLGRMGAAGIVHDRLAQIYGPDQVSLSLEKSNASSLFDRYRIDYSVRDESGLEHLKTISILGDPSLPDKEGLVDLEINSAVMNTSQDVADFDAVVASLVSAGFNSDSVYGGLHLHFGFEDFRSTEVATLLLMFDSFHTELEGLLAVSPQRKRYGQRLTPEFVDRLHAVAKVYTHGQKERSGWILRLARDERISRERNHALNILNLGPDKIGTIEFRMPNSTVDAQSRAALRQFLKAFVLAVRNKDEKVLAQGIQAEKSQQALPLRRLFETLNLNFDQFKETLSKNL
jgi:hypothetical protein